MRLSTSTTLSRSMSAIAPPPSGGGYAAALAAPSGNGATSLIPFTTARNGLRRTRSGVSDGRTTSAEPAHAATAHMRTLPNRHTRLRIVLLSAAWTTLASASQSMPPGLYDVTTETSMPNLEENLRYTTTHERRCLNHEDLTDAFPVLSHPALKGCSLGAESREGDVVSYALICEGGHGTTGDARWEL